MKVKLLSGNHSCTRDGARVRYLPGDVFEVDKSEYEAFKFKFEKVENLEEKVKQYHKGGGYYDIPGAETVKGKKKAIEVLKAK